MKLYLLSFVCLDDLSHAAWLAVRLKVQRMQRGVNLFDGCGSCGLTLRVARRCFSDWRLVQHEVTLMPGLELRGFIPTHIRAGGKANDHVLLCVFPLVHFIDLDHRFAPMRRMLAHWTRRSCSGLALLDRVGKQSDGRDFAGHYHVCGSKALSYFAALLVGDRIAASA